MLLRAAKRLIEVIAFVVIALFCADLIFNIARGESPGYPLSFLPPIAIAVLVWVRKLES